MFKYKHKKTGLYLTKRKLGYSSVYRLTTKGTVWGKNCLKTLSLIKEHSIYGYNQKFTIDEFETITCKLIEE